MLGKYEVIPATLYFGPVTLRELPKLLPFNIGDTEWTLFLAATPPNAFDSIPDELSGKKGVVNPQAVKMSNDIIDLGQLAGNIMAKNCAIFYRQFESPEAGRMTVGVSADWWMELYVNGDMVFSSMKNGNISHSFVPDDHIVEIPIKAGRNLIAAKVLSGSEGWRFVCGKPTRRVGEDSLLTICRGPDWKPIDMNRLNVKGGTALDFSSLAGERRGVAGEHGRVIATPSGRLVFEKGKGHFIRFHSFTCNTWKLLLAERKDKNEIEELAANIARLGYNMVRIQGIDASIMGCYQAPFKRIPFATPGWLPQKAEDLQINPESLDRFDYYLACLKKNGIYFNLDLMTRLSGYCNDPGANLKVSIFFNQEYRRHWEAAAGYLLNHRNPYTGVCLKDDPALAIVEPNNEQELLLNNAQDMKEMTPGFRQYLQDKYRTDEALQIAWGVPGISFAKTPDIDETILRKSDVRAQDAGSFLIKAMTGLSEWYYGVIRKNGYTGLITQWDMIMRMMEMPVRAKMPVIAQHSYWHHPGYYPSKNLVKKSKEFEGYPGRDLSIGHSSSMNSSYFRASAAIRFLDRPFMITEYSHSAPSRYRHERGLFFGSYAALQGWDSLSALGKLPAIVPGVNLEPLVSFESQLDPISRASEVVASLVWFRGDVKEAPHTIQLTLFNKSLFPEHFLAAIGDDYAKLAMITRIGLIYPEVTSLETVGKVKSDLELTPTEFSPLAVNQWYVAASSGDGSMFPALFEKLHAAKILPDANITDYTKRLYQSETGEITLDGKNETMIVVTPRLEGSIIKKNTPVRLGNVEIVSCSKPASVVIASLDKEKNLADSKHLLLVFAVNALNEGQTFEYTDMQLVVEMGHLPVLIETAKLSLTLKNSQTGKPEVYPLHLDGTRMERIPAKYENGKLSLSLDTSQLPYGAVFFEIVFP